MKGIPTVPNVQTATRVSPKVWRCTTCGRLNDTRKADQRCGHVPPWVEADRAAEADLARFLTEEQSRLAAHWRRMADQPIVLTPALRKAIADAPGGYASIARHFGITRDLVQSIKRDAGTAVGRRRN